MEDFAKMDVFFIVSTLAVVIVAALLAVALYKLIRILRSVEQISGMVADEGKLLRSDIADLRSSLKHEGFKWKHFSHFARQLAERIMGRRKK